MKTRKILSAAMALVMAMALTVPAFASKNTTTITAKYAEITLDVTVPSKVSATINPYGLPITYTDEKEVDYTISGLKITTDPTVIVNNGTVDLDLGATVTGVVAGSAKLVDATNLAVAMEGTAATATEAAVKPANNVFMYLEASSISDATLKADADSGDVLASDYYSKVAAWATTTDSSYTLPSKPYIVVGTTASSTVENERNSKETVNTNTLVTLKGATDSTGTTAQTGNAAMIRLDGYAAKDPATAWAKTDSVTVTVAWSFTPWSK